MPAGAADGWHPWTIAVHAGRGERRPGEPLTVGVELASTYQAGAPRGYGRSRNATWEAFEEAVGQLEGGRAFAFASGLAATAAAADLVPAGGTVVIDRAAYHGVRVLLADLAGNGRLAVREVDTTDTAGTLDACRGAGLLWLESPTNPLLDAVDLRGLAAGARAAGCLVVVDNTFATPLRQRPLELGADIVVHSATKLLSGHSDVVMGVAVAADEALGRRIERHRLRFGAVAGPMEAFLALRGLRTLPVRLERAEATAALVADRLAAHPAVARVRWPGWGTIVSFELDGAGAADAAAAADAVCRAVRLAVHATSLGGVETLVERRAQYEPPGSIVPPGLIRVSIGLEHPDDLWADLVQALAATPTNDSDQ